jgi:hypothetical protein
VIIDDLVFYRLCTDTLHIPAGPMASRCRV